MSETDRRLKDHLNTNQAKRERMCLETLSVQEGYSELQPRLPKGGPDGGRDIQGVYKGELFFGAAGFVNDATDTEEHRRQIKGKFRDDLKNALSIEEGKPKPSGFVFLTNVGLTPTIISDLQKLAYDKGISYCEIYDRERLRIILDSNRGYAIRFRYLDISLNDAEQKDFFSAWADGITSLIGSGISGIDQTTKRIQFLLESQFLLDSLGAIVRFDRPIWDVCRGQFFFQTTLTLRVHSEGLLGFTFGGGTQEIVETLEEWQASERQFTQNSKYGFAFSWLIPGMEQYRPFEDKEDTLEYPQRVSVEDRSQYVRTAQSSGILEVQNSAIYFDALSGPFLFRMQPTCKLIELHDCMIIFECNKELVSKIAEIAIIGGGYELLKIKKDDFRAEVGGFDRLNIPKESKLKIDSHEWSTIRPSTGDSAFSIDLMHRTPKRYDWV